MNSKTIFDYLPAETGSELKRAEESIRALKSRVEKIGVTEFLKVCESEPTTTTIQQKRQTVTVIKRKGLSHDQLIDILKELQNNPDPMLYYMNECFIKMGNAIRTAYTVPMDDDKSLSQWVEESLEHREKSKDIQSYVNGERKLKRLVMNEFFLWRSELTSEVLENRILENAVFKPLLGLIGDAEHKRAVIRILAILFQMNKDIDFITFLETSYDETVKQYVNEHSVKVSAGEWSITGMEKRITDNLLAERRNREQWVFGEPVVPVPMDGLLGITDKKYKHALSRYIKSEGVGLYSLNEKNERLEIDLILILFTAVYSYLEPMFKREHIEESIPSKFCIGAEDISKYLYGNKRGLTAMFNEIVEKMRYTKYNAEGMVEEKNGPVSLKVIDELEYNDFLNTVTFTSPLLSHIVTAMLTDGHNKAIRKMKEREKKESDKAKKQNRDEVESVFYKDDFPAKVVRLEKPSLVTQKDDNAKAIVREILSWVKSANLFEEVNQKHVESNRQAETVTLVDGDKETYTTDRWREEYSVSYHQVGEFSKGKKKGTKKNNEILVSTLIERVPALEQKLNTAKNKTAVLNDTFTHVWIYMHKHTMFPEKYPYVKIPGSNYIKEIDKMDLKNDKDKAAFKKWVPTLKNMHALKIKLEPAPSDQQIQKQIKQRNK